MQSPRVPNALVVLALVLSGAPLLGIDACGPGSCPSDADGDGVCDATDACPGSDDSLDADSDGAPDACDTCPTDATDDADNNGLCDGAPAMTLAPLPRSLAVVQRGADDTATVRFKGEVRAAGYDELALTVERDGATWLSQSAALEHDGTSAPFDFSIDLPAGLHNYTLFLDIQGSAGSTRVTTRANIAVGDLILIQGQSNAVAADYHSEGLANQSQSPWIRSFGSSSTTPATAAADLEWGVAEALLYQDHASIGAWGLRMAELLLQQGSMPIGIINGAVGGTYISQHQRNDADPEDLNTIYGRFLYRARQGDFAPNARIMIWYQGESDGYGMGETSTAAQYPTQFDALRSNWKTDFPALEQIYVFQVRYGCGLDHPSDAYVGLAYYDSALQYLGGQLLEFWAGQSWTPYSMTGAAPANAAWVAPVLMPIVYGAVYYDDASMVLNGGSELLTNSSFETGATFPDAWTTYGTGTYTWLEGTANTGSRSMRLESQASSALLYQLVPGLGGQTYTVSSWARAEYSGRYYDVRDALRTLSSRYDDVTLMSTNAAPGHDGCHFYYSGYRELGDRIARLVLRDFYDGPDAAGIEPPEILTVTQTAPAELRLKVRNAGAGLTLEPGAWMYFRVEGAYVTGGAADGDEIVLTLSQPTQAPTLAYTDHALDAPDVVNSLGVGLLSFIDVPIQRP